MMFEHSAPNSEVSEDLSKQSPRKQDSQSVDTEEFIQDQITQLWSRGWGEVHGL